MKNSTIIGISGVALAGVGVYLYLKGKKSTTTNSAVTTPTQTAPLTDDTKLLQDLGVKIEEPKVTPYVAPSVPVPTVSLENIQKALLSLNIDQTRGINELASPNYIEAKRIAGNMKEIDKMSKTEFGRDGIVSSILKKYSELSGETVKQNTSGKQWTNQPLNTVPSAGVLLTKMTAKINSLGYKVLPNFEIEKM
jgi:hypothetical protein